MPTNTHTVSFRRLRRLPVGAELVSNGAHFRLWAPKRTSVEAVLTSRRGEQIGRTEQTVVLTAEDDGFFSGLAEGAGAGDLYRFRLDGGGDLYPDPASRLQPEGPHGPSCLVDPGLYRVAGRRLERGDRGGRRALRDAHRHLHAGGHLGGRGAASCPSWPASASPAWR